MTTSTDAATTRRRSTTLIALATVLSLGHHLDHVVRGNHSGWPATEDVTPFTYSLAVYPLLLLGLVLSWSGRAGARYWTVFSGGGALFLMAVHVGPSAVEPPRDIVGPYSSALVGQFAYVWLLALLAVVLLHLMTCAAWWRQEWQGRRPSTPGPARGVVDRAR